MGGREADNTVVGTGPDLKRHSMSTHSSVFLPFTMKITRPRNCRAKDNDTNGADLNQIHSLKQSCPSRPAHLEVRKISVVVRHWDCEVACCAARTNTFSLSKTGQNYSTCSFQHIQCSPRRLKDYKSIYIQWNIIRAWKGMKFFLITAILIVVGSYLIMVLHFPDG